MLDIQFNDQDNDGGYIRFARNDEHGWPLSIVSYCGCGDVGTRVEKILSYEEVQVLKRLLEVI